MDSFFPDDLIFHVFDKESSSDEHASQYDYQSSTVVQGENSLPVSDSGLQSLIKPDVKVEEAKPDSSADRNNQIEEISGESKDGHSAKEWLQRRRGQIAKASRKARQKRRNEINKLQEENKKLKVERVSHLAKIGELEEKVRKIRTEGEAVDVQLENELLRKQLEEHKLFIRGCKRLIDGVPTDSTVLKQMLDKGANFAETTVYSLIAQSLRDEWLPAKLNPKFFDSNCVPGVHLAVCYKRYKAKLEAEGNKVSKEISKMSVRIDMVFPNADVSDVLCAYSRAWIDEEYFNSVYFCTEQAKIRPIHISEKSAKIGEPLSPDNFSGDALMGSEDIVRVFSYIETRQNPEPDHYWVYVWTRRQRELARSTLLLPESLTPSAAMSAPGRVVTSLKKDSVCVLADYSWSN